MKQALLLIVLGILLGCESPTEEPTYVPKPYELEIPEGFPTMRIPDDNLLTVEGVELGRKLYYDKILHKNEEKSCATCHIQDFSFTSGIDVLPAVNLGWSQNYLWDGSVKGSVEDIMRHEIENFFETNLTLINNDPEYPKLFNEAFGVGEISTEEIVKALAQFFRTMNSGNSKFDRVLRNEENFTNEEFLGYELFFTERGDCFHCHATVFMTDNIFHNNALDSLPDPGYFNVTGDSLDYGKFKSPTLRNIELTAPYMHDGRYQSLEEVVEFYSSGLNHSATVDPLMKILSDGGVQLNMEEKAALVAFLKTLTDYEFIENPELSDPLK